jgi:O-antigen/teichoic acid export membrane protein
MLLLTNEENVGIFQANYRLGIFMMLVVSMFDYAWRPFFLNIAKEKDAKQIFAGILTYFTGFCTIVLIVLTFFIEDIIKIPLPGRGTLIGAKYWAGIYIVPIVLFAYIFNGIYINLMPGIYFEKKTKFLPFITGLGAIVNVAGNFILIPVMGLYGAAIATLLSYISMAVYIYFVTKKFYPVKYDFKKIYLLIFINIAAMAVFYISYYKVLNINLIVKVILVIIFTAVTIKVAGLWRAKQLLRRSKSDKKLLSSETPEAMPQVTDENPEL